MVNTDLEEVRCEVKDVKAALSSGSAYLGMKGDQLSQYFLQLNAKENLLLSQTVQVQQPNGKNVETKSGGYAQQQQQSAVASVIAQVEPTEPNEPVAPFDPKSMPSVVGHLIEYERYHKECAKALRALRSFGYALKVSADARILPQVLRLLQLHCKVDTVVLGCVQVICNCADEVGAALGPLAEEAVLGALINAISRQGASKKLIEQGSEAIARIVAAGESESGKSEGGPKSQLGKVFNAAVGNCDATCGPFLEKAFEAMMIQEMPIIDLNMVVMGLYMSSEKAKSSATAAVCWLELARQFSTALTPKEPGQDPAHAWSGVRGALYNAGGIKTSLDLMKLFLTSEDVQITVLSTMSVLIGQSMQALESFAQGGGLQQIEAAVRAHPESLQVQTKGVRSLGSGAGWPAAMQKSAGYNQDVVIEICKEALKKHGDAAELATAALQQFVKVSQHMTGEQFKEQVGSGDFKAVLERILQVHSDVKLVQGSGATVLDKIK